MNLYDRIDNIIKERNTSRRQLAIKAGIPIGTLQSALTRKRNITVEQVQRIATALDMDIGTLMRVEVDENMETVVKYLPNNPITSNDNETISFHITGPEVEKARQKVLRDTVIKNYDRLNYFGQIKAYNYVTVLTETPKYTSHEEYLKERQKIIDEWIKEQERKATEEMEEWRKQDAAATEVAKEEK
jgi:transcriptional regulator with XRE-family HTH domain